MSNEHYGLIGGAPSDASAETLRQLEGYNRGQQRNPAVEGASALWAIGAAETAAGVVGYPVSWTDIASDQAWAKGMLRLAGVGGGDFAFFSYIYSRSAQTWPWLKAGFEAGAKMATGMPTQWDAYRLEMYCRLFSVKFIFGLTPEVLDGLEGGGHKLEKVFAKVERMIAFGSAWQRLRDAGLAPWRLHWLGPIIGVDTGDGDGVRFDHQQWSLRDDNGALFISNLHPRAGVFASTKLAVRGEVRDVGGAPRLFVED